MKINKKTHYGKLFILIGLLILLPSMISAFAVSSKYYPGYPLYMSSGEGKEVKILLQNLASENDVTVLVNLATGSDVLGFVKEDKTYLIPAGEKTWVDMQVNIPEGIAPDTIYPIDIRFTTVTSSEEGQTMGFGQSIGQKFDIIADFTPPVQEAPEEEKSNSTLYIIIGIVLVFGIIAVFAMRKRKKQEDSQK